MMSATMHLSRATYSHCTYTAPRTLGCLFLDVDKNATLMGDREALVRLIEAAADLVDEIDRQERLKAAALVSQQ